MRLINCATLQHEEFFDHNIPKYAILSHTWGNDEVTFTDFTLHRVLSTSKEGYRKIDFTCTQAEHDGLNYVWVDTCCIDKSSSAELSEAINSMYAWYKGATACYTYLSDVSKDDFNESFPKSRWLTRGWTLQELLAPDHLMFYDRDWNELGTKLHHASWISEITSIDSTALMPGIHVRLDSFCAAKRMSWASCRETTRVEDMAYCLLGIFNVNMPLLYGEGQRAFTRLQEEIMKNFDDDSILAWGLDNTIHPLGLVPSSVTRDDLMICHILATSPKDFRSCGDLKYGAPSDFAYTMTNQGLQMQLPLVPAFTRETGTYSYLIDPHYWIGLLSCSTSTDSNFLGIILFDFEASPGSRMQVARVCARNGPSCHTVVVGPRTAAQSISKNITIIPNYKNRRNYYWRCRQIVINESQSLRDIGYHVSNGTGVQVYETDSAPKYKPIWDEEIMLLSIEGSIESIDLLEFCFEPQWSKADSKFTIFMRTTHKRALVRRGSSFTRKEKLDFYHCLEGELGYGFLENETIADRDGNEFNAVATITEKKLYDRRIFELNVNAVRSAARSAARLD